MALPSTPHNPYPGNQEINLRSGNNYLTWTSSQSNNYDVYFGETSPPTILAERIQEQYVYVTFNKSKTYYWQIVARNGEGEASSPVWSFQTEPALQPEIPNDPYPEDGGKNVQVQDDLYWSSEALNYDVYFGETNPPSLIATQITRDRYSPNLSKEKTYYWQITSRNEVGETTGPVWTFQTEVPQPPPIPRNPSPSNNQSQISQYLNLSWSSTSISDDIYLGTTDPPPLFESQNTNRYIYAELSRGETYYWQVISRNDLGTTSGPIWKFTTEPPPPPAPNPPTNLRATTVTSSRVSLEWDAPSDSQIEYYTVYLDSYQRSQSYSTQFTDSNYFNHGSSYTYQIKAYNQSGESGFSNAITVTIPDTQQLDGSAIAAIKFYINHAQLEPVDSSLLAKEYSSGEINLISNQLQKCETAFNLTRLNAGSLVVDRQEITDGNITVVTEREYGTTTTTYGKQTKTWSKRRTYQQRLDDYYKEVKLLKEILEL